MFLQKAWKQTSIFLQNLKRYYQKICLWFRAQLNLTTPLRLNLIKWSSRKWKWEELEWYRTSHYLWDCCNVSGFLRTSQGRILHSLAAVQKAAVTPSLAKAHKERFFFCWEVRSSEIHNDYFSLSIGRDSGCFEKYCSAQSKVWHLFI